MSFCLLSFLVPPSFFLVFAYLFFLRRWCLCLCLCPFVGALRLFFWVFVVLLPLAGAHVVGGGSLAWVVMYVAVSVSSLLLSPALKKAREVLPCATYACLFFSLSRPLASCPCCFLSCCACLFLMHAHAQRRRPVGLGFTSSCVAALLSQDPLGVGPPALPWFGSCCPHHG